MPIARNSSWGEGVIVGAAEGKGIWGESPSHSAIFTIFQQNNTFLGLNFCIAPSLTIAEKRKE